MFDKQRKRSPAKTKHSSNSLLEPKICYIDAQKPTLKWNGDPIYIITGIKLHENVPASSKYLDQPLFTIDDGRIQSTRNPLINTEDSNPDFLVAFAERLVHGDIPYPASIRASEVDHIRSAFLQRATPRELYEKSRRYADVIFKDDAHPETYRIDGLLFFKNMANRTVLGFDIHDILHHPLQMAAWPEQFQFITQAGRLAHELPDKKPKALRLQKLTQLLWLACFEESLITLDGQLSSFGCLNWLSPSETPLDTKPDMSDLSVDDQKIAFRWHYLDAFKDMYRIQIGTATLLGARLTWVEKLGYTMSEPLKALVESEDPRPFENLDYYDALKLGLKAPKSPEELFANAIKLIKAEFSK